MRARLINSKFGKQFVIDPSELKGTAFDPLIRFLAHPNSFRYVGIKEAVEADDLYQELLKFFQKAAKQH